MWMSVIGGSRVYVDRASRAFSGEVHSDERVERVERVATGARVHTARRTKDYDAVILAAHAPQALELLGDGATPAERETLSAFTYQPNPVVLHTDASFMPKERRAWASWNWYAESGDTMKDALVLTYWINNLQLLPDRVRPVMETLNAHRSFADGTVLAEMSFDHPLFTKEAIRAQRRVPELQGADAIWFAGAWQRYGFHEDGLLSAVRVAERLGATLPWAEELDESRTVVRGQEPAANRIRPVLEPGTEGLA